MGDVTRRTFNTTVIGGATMTIIGSMPGAAQACVSLQGAVPDDLAVPHDDELARMRHVMAALEDLSDRLRYLEPQAAMEERRDLIDRLRKITGEAAVTLERMDAKLDREQVLLQAGGESTG